MNEVVKEKKVGRGLIIGTIILGAFISSLNQTVMTATLPSIMRQFGIDAGVGQWLTTGYLLVLGIMIPCTGYLMDRYSTKKLYLFSMFMFLAGCILAIFSQSFYLLLFARIIQAIGAGILLPMPQVVAFRLYEPEKRGTIMGIVGLTTGFGPAFGPTFAGWVIDNSGWHMIFYIMSALSLLCILAAVVKLADEKLDSAGKLDILSVILSTIGFSGLLAGVTNQGNYGTGSMLTIIPFTIGLICTVFFVVRQLKIKSPLLELRVFASKDFTFGTVLLIFIYGCILTISIMIPLYIQSVRGLTATASGLVLLPGSLLLALLNPVTGKILDKKGPFMLSVVGLLILGIGTFGMASMNTGTSPLFVGFANGIQMLGIVALLQPLMTWSVNAVDGKYVSHATAIMNTGRQVGGSILSAVFVTIMTAVSRKGSALKGIQITFIIIAIVVIISIGAVLVFMRPKRIPAGAAPTASAPAAGPASSDAIPEVLKTKDNFVITIGREYGSGGREIGSRVAGKLGIKLYDRELIDMAAIESGFSPDYIKAHEEHSPTANRLYDFAIQNYETLTNAPVNAREFSAEDIMFVVQSKLIQEIAAKESCVIVGRCADYILKDRKNCLRVFICSDESHRTKRLMDKYHISEKEAMQEAKKKDHRRSEYYLHYTGQEWGAAQHFHLVLNSGSLGVDKTAELIIQSGTGFF